MWVLGNDYRNRTPFYGAYPPAYLRRVMALFPDKRRVLHLFSGSLPKGDYTRFDIRRDLEPEVCGDAHRLTKHVGESAFDLILADPPYSAEDAAKYGSMPMVQRKVVVSECARALATGGHLVWLDTVLPMYRKAELTLCGLIGIVRSTNHRFRMVTIFEKVDDAHAAR